MKNELSNFGKLFYYVGVIKYKTQPTTFRLLHPLTIIGILIYGLVLFSLEIINSINLVEWELF